MNMTASGKVSNKAKRISAVALSGAVMALFWVLVDQRWNVEAVVVSSATSLVMLLAGFVDFKHQDTAELYHGEAD